MYQSELTYQCSHVKNLMMKFSALFLVSTFLLSGVGWTYPARTVSVHDGDTLKVRLVNNELVTIRLYGVDAPEAKQAFGLNARKRLASLVSRRDVEIEPVETDRYGRTVALVRLKNGTLVNEVMVADGLAWVYEEYCHKELCLGLKDLETSARMDKLGLWGDSNPTRPSDWRREHKTEEWYQKPMRALETIARKIKVVLHY
ncbi:MAG: thermonuclease family protein [Humidesulfovibrio sp.]|nr:thermonuclease family protein [Humidesulfovibrio sp.]